MAVAIDPHRAPRRRCRRPFVRLEPLEVPAHRGGALLHDRRRACDGAQRRQASPLKWASITLAREHGPVRGARCRAPSAAHFLVLAPTAQAARDCDEQQHRQQRADSRGGGGYARPRRGEGVFDVPGFARDGGWSFATGTNRPFSR